MTIVYHMDGLTVTLKGCLEVNIKKLESVPTGQDLWLLLPVDQWPIADRYVLFLKKLGKPRRTFFGNSCA